MNEQWQMFTLGHAFIIIGALLLGGAWLVKRVMDERVGRLHDRVDRQQEDHERLEQKDGKIEKSIEKLFEIIRGMAGDIEVTKILTQYLANGGGDKVFKKAFK